MSETAEEATTEPRKTLTDKEWNNLLNALKAIAETERENEKAERQRFKDEQKRFKEEKKIWRAEKWLLIINAVLSGFSLILQVAKMFWR